MSVEITFIFDDQRRIVDGDVGETLLEVAERHDIPLDANCGGMGACGKCHVHVDEEYIDKMPEPTEDEEDVLDRVFDVQKNSRLGCAITITEELDGLVVIIPDNE